VVCEIAPDVAVTVTWEVPVGVGTEVVVEPLLPLLLQPSTPALTTSPNNMMGSIAKNLRLLQVPSRRNAAKGVMAAMPIPNPLCVGGAAALVV
jgi:hypothetical protein